MTRRILPHAPEANFVGTVLAVGEIVYNETSGRIHRGDGVTPGGVPIGGSGGVSAVSEYGSLLTTTASRAALAAGIAKVSDGGTLVIDQEFSLGTSPVTNPGTELSGRKAAYFETNDVGSLGNKTGGRPQNKIGRDWSRLSWGQEYLIPRFLTRLNAGSALSIGIIGDSNTEAYAGPLIAALMGSLPGATVVNYGASGTTFEQSRTATGGFAAGQPYAGKDLAAVLAAGHDLLIDCYGGTNDPVYGGTPASYYTSKRTGYQTIRAHANGGVQRLSVVMCTAGPQNDGGVNGGTTSRRDELWNARVRPKIIALADEFSACFVDKNGRVPDAFVDFLNNGAQNTMLDTNRVHTSAALSAMIAQWVYEDIVPSTFRGAGNFMFGDYGTGVASTLAPSAYPRGFSIARATVPGSAWPLNGHALTIMPTSTGGSFGFQLNWAFGSTGAQFRTAPAGAWGPWNSLGVADLGNKTMASLIATYPPGMSSARATPGDGWPLDGFVVTFREPAAGVYGYQDIFAYGADAPAQRRHYVSAGWGAWHALW